MDADKNKELRAQANQVFAVRDDRLRSMTDESVPVYYTCIMCQAFSPSHVCIVTPERLGLCGAVSWLDAKATNELDPTGPCQIVPKERCVDEKLGRFDDVDEAIAKYSHGALERVIAPEPWEGTLASRRVEKVSRDLSRVEAGNPGFPRLVQVTSGGFSWWL